jgi:UDP-N-acetylmuramate dehydrogenase
MEIIQDKDLANLTNFKIGGKADYFIEIEKEEDLYKFYLWQKNKRLPIFILGGGTNILMDDFKGVVVKNSIKYIKEIESGIIEVSSGVLVSDLLNLTIEKGYQGLEWAGGLPGTVGGAVEGSVGCFGGEFKNLVLEVKAFNLENGDIKKFSKDKCDFYYRDSFFRKNKNWFILSCLLSFKTNFDRDELKKIAKEKIEYRKEKHPIEYPNAGSIFKNYPLEKAPEKLRDFVVEMNKVKNDPFPVIPIAFLISEAGLAGKRIGDAQISIKHSNFIINLSRATFEDVFNLIDFTKKTLEDKFEIVPEVEIKIISTKFIS